MLITGPSGNVGDELVTLLEGRPDSVQWRVASRHPDGLRNRLGSGAAGVVEFDFFDRSTWCSALAGVDSMFLTVPAAR